METNNCCKNCKYFRSDPEEMKDLCCGRALENGIFTYVINDNINGNRRL